ncbi:MAG: Xaa-Pro peptidase family protein [Candidatus Micrarchaeota archaeon]
MRALQGRVKRLFKELAAAGKHVDCVAIASSAPDPNFLCLAGLSQGVFEHSLLVASQSGLQAVVPRLELPSVPSGVEAFAYSSTAEKRALAKQLLKGFGRVGCDEKTISHANYLLLSRCSKKLVGVSRELALTRGVKEPREVKAISAAARLTRKAIGAALDELQEGDSEQELAARIAVAFAEENAAPAFDSICAFGGNTAVPHHVVSRKSARRGDFVLVDAGARLAGYCADLTRTIVLGREPSAAQASMLEAVEGALQAALRRLRPGVRASKVHAAASQLIDSSGFKGRFIHSAGHSIGLSVHDGLRLSAKADFALREGMVFAVEPAVYVPKIGGVRLEEDVLVTKAGCRVL